MALVKTKGRTIRKVMGGGGVFEQQDFFFSSNSWEEIFLDRSMNIFQG